VFIDIGLVDRNGSKNYKDIGYLLVLRKILKSSMCGEWIYNAHRDSNKTVYFLNFAIGYIQN